MKSIFNKIAIVMLFSCFAATNVLAQTTVETVKVEDEESVAKLKVLQARLNRMDAKLKQQAANLNKTYNDVTPEVQENLNDREDSIYLAILSQKRTIELEMKEVKKSQEKTYLVKKTEVPVQNENAEQTAKLKKIATGATKSSAKKKVVRK